MKILKGAAIFLLGSGCGFAVSYVYFKKQYDEKKMELEEIKEHYNNKLYGEIEKAEAEQIIKKEGYISYDNIKEKDLVKVVEEVSEEAMTNDRPNEGYPDDPIKIDEIDFSETELSFEKADLDYYIDDGALVDETDALIEIEDSIGYEILEDFINDESEEIIYVRNASLGTDYQIKKVSGSYSNTIGIGGDEDE